MQNCPDCNTEPGHYHVLGCDVERCPICGGQFISCDCTELEQSPEEAIKWTGKWPGVAECQEFGWYCKWVPSDGWVECSADDLDASPDLNRLSMEARWDKAQKRYVKVDYAGVLNRSD